MSAFEYWFAKETAGFDLEIYLARDCDPEAIKRGELEPGKLTEFQFYYTKKDPSGNKTIREYNNEMNAVVAGEFLRDELGYGPAKDLLTEIKMPEDILIWKLGDKG